MEKSYKSCMLLMERLLRDMQEFGVPELNKSIYLEEIDTAVAVMAELDFEHAHWLLERVELWYWADLSLEVNKAA